jgi:ATP-dependent Clp protease ATP-binding subunit ClpA
MSALFRRYEKDAKLAVYYAAVLAAHSRRDAISPEDLLLGLTWRQHAPDCEFRHLKESADTIWQAVGMPHLPISSKPLAPEKLPLNPSARRVLRLTKLNADRKSDYWIDIDHILCALIQNQGAAAQALASAGWTIERIELARTAGHQRYPPKYVSWQRRRWTRLQEFFATRGFVRGLLVGLGIYLLIGALAALGRLLHLSD